MDANAFGLCKENKLPIVVFKHQPARRDGQGPGRRTRRHDRPMTLRQLVLSLTTSKHAKQLMERRWKPSSESFLPCATGKATTALLDLVRVEAYGNEMPLTQVASVAAPEPKLLTVQPWDKGLLKAVEKGILASDLGLTPSNDRQHHPHPDPPLTEERRKELVKVVHKFAEEGPSRHPARADRDDEPIKKTEHVSSDDQKHAEKEVQKTHDDHLKGVGRGGEAKEAEIMEV